MMKPLPRRNREAATAIDGARESVARDTQKRKPRARIAARISLAVIVCTVLTLGLFRLRSPAAHSVEIARERLVIGTAERGPFREYVPVHGTLEPEESIFLDSVEGGRVTAIHVVEGTNIKSGTAVVALANTELELQVIAREAQYSEQLSNLASTQIAFDQADRRYEQELLDAQLKIDLSEASLARRLPVEKTGVSQSEIDRLHSELAHQKKSAELLRRARRSDSKHAKRNLSQLRRSVGRMDQSLGILRASLTDLAISAPIDGQLTTLNVKVGEVVAPGQRVGQVDKMGRYKVRAKVDEFYLPRVRKGQVATATIGQQVVKLVVDRVYPTVADRQFEIDLVFADSPPAGQRRGQSLRVQLELGGDEDALAIPNGPFYDQTGGQWAFVVSSNGSVANRRELSLGRRTPTHIEVRTGLKPGERILTSSYQDFLDAQTVELVSK